jgi:hypothetical protein
MNLPAFDKAKTPAGYFERKKQPNRRGLRQSDVVPLA